MSPRFVAALVALVTVLADGPPAQGDGRAPPRPLVLFLHGYGGSPRLLDDGLDVTALAARHHLIPLLPAGRLDRAGQRFWRAGPSCCDFFGADAAGVDDRARLLALLRDTQRRTGADSQRLYVIGHSNGGHLAYRLACAPDSGLAAIVSLAGADFGDAPCASSTRLSVLQVQSAHDPIVPYQPACVTRPGRPRSLCYPGAETSTRRWALRVGCAPQRVAERPLRMAGGLSVQREHYAACPPGLEVAFWTVHGGGHMTDTFAPLMDTIVAWLIAHPRPRAMR